MATKICQRCKEEKTTANFVAAASVIHGSSLPICRKCIAKLIKDNTDEDGKNWNIVDKIC